MRLVFQQKLFFDVEYWFSPENKKNLEKTEQEKYLEANNIDK